jgi:hypothetical protein
MPARPGILFNRDAITRLEFQFPHQLVFQSQGWRLNIQAAGRLVVRLNDGGTENIDVTPGDALFSSAEYIYLRPQA